MHDDFKPLWLLPVCVVVAVLVLAIDITIKNAIIAEAQALREEIKDARSGQASRTRDARAKRARDNGAHMVDGNATVEARDVPKAANGRASGSRDLSG